MGIVLLDKLALGGGPLAAGVATGLALAMAAATAGVLYLSTERRRWQWGLLAACALGWGLLLAYALAAQLIRVSGVPRAAGLLLVVLALVLGGGAAAVGWDFLHVVRRPTRAFGAALLAIDVLSFGGLLVQGLIIAVVTGR